ncbi:MAG: Xaa-Pro dipeptidyl-peptidase, partial [Flavobacteriaceae bacterium]|jgi:X-Pro dipeptidyl-peptidase|nr:Xaa-Pro dipeptidyl-peptidase [Flavobacteriaceae bacterium]
MKKLIHLITLFIFIAINAQEKSVPFFINGEAQVVGSFKDETKWIRHDLWVETSFDSDDDGKMDRMHVDVTRPAQTEDGLKLPVVYESSPYYAGTAGLATGLFWDVKHELGQQPKPRKHVEVIRKGKRPIISNSQIRTWVPRGFVVVHSSSPGTGLSDGAPTVGGINESLAPKAVIDWLNGRARGYTSREGTKEVVAYWSTGKVGMTGTSYNGTLPLAAATTGVEGLEAIIPIAPNTSYYHYYRSNGLVRSPGGYLGEDIDVLYDYIHSGKEENRARNNRVIRDTEMINGMDRITGDYNDFWEGRDYLNQMKPMKAALLMAHGFNDWNVMPEHSYRISKKAIEMGIPTQIYYHQDGHGGPPPLKMMNRWFTRYLFGIENGVEKDPKAWIVREYNSRQKPTPYQAYPNPDASLVTLSLHPGAPGTGGLFLKKNKIKTLEILTDDYSYDGASLAKAKTSENRLLYLSPVLKEDIHLSGLSTLTIKVASSKKAANLSVWLVSLPWNSDQKAKRTDNIITRGWADIQNYKSLTESTNLIPGKFYTMSFDLQPDDQIIKKGQQIGLMIFSSDPEFTLHPKPGTILTVDINSTSLKIPVIGGRKSFYRATK